MSALAFVLRLDAGPPQTAEVESLLSAMAARGPDRRSVWADGPAGFGHGLLINSPEAAAERYPIGGADSRYQLLWDGRLDNRDSLFKSLASEGVDLPPSAPDPALVLAGFARWREDLPSRLDGDFSFVVWDREAQTAFAARDPMGARPFYFVKTARRFAVASEDEALLRLPGISATPAVERIADRLFDREVAGPDWRQSWLRDVAILMPGHALTIDLSGRLVNTAYHRWSPRPSLRFSGETEALEAFDEVFGRAVAERTRGLDRVGIITSGGIDSASIVVAARRKHSARAIDCFSVVHDEPSECIETRAIHQIVSSVSANPFQLSVPSLGGVVSRLDLAAFHKRPHPIDYVVPIIAMMCLAGRQQGHRVLLHGATGDVALRESNFYLLRTAREMGVRAAWRESRQAHRHHTYIAGVSRLWVLKQALIDDVLPHWFLRCWAHLRRVEAASEAERRANIRPAVEAFRALCLARSQSKRPKRSAVTKGAGQSQREHLQTLFPDGILCGLEGYERVAGRYGVELRDPWADRQVIEFCLALPTHWKTGDGWTKLIARRWAGQLLPEDCVYRSDRTHLGWHLLPQIKSTWRTKQPSFDSDNLAAAWSALVALAGSELDTTRDQAAMARTIMDWWSGLATSDSQ